MDTMKELNKALSDIYSDLEKLQNAREQVEIVTKSSNELAKSTSILLEKLKELANQFGEENSNNNSKLTRTLVEFENKINDISEKGNDSISEYIESFKKQIVGVIEQFSMQLANNEKNLNAISNLNNEKISNKIEEFGRRTNDLKNNTENVIEKIQTLALSNIENQEEIISRTISEYVESFKKQIDGVIEQFSIQLVDTEKSLNTISNLNNEKISKKIHEFEKTTNDLKTIAENGIEKIETIAISKIENQEEIISKTIESIQNTNFKADKLIEVITNYDIPNSLETINQKLDFQEKVNKMNKTLLILLLSIIGIGGAVAIGLLIKML